jgi:excisionase family DNA binding protein
MRQQQLGSDPTASLVQDPRGGGPGGDAGKVELSVALDELMTAEQVAALLLLPASTVKDYARRGVLPSIKLGKHRRFVRSQVQGAIDVLARSSR